MDKDKFFKCGNCDSQCEENAIEKMQILLGFVKQEVHIADAIAYLYDICWSDLLENDFEPSLQESPVLEFCKPCADLLGEQYNANLNFETATDPKSLVQKIKRYRVQPDCIVITKVEVEPCLPNEDEPAEDPFLAFDGQLNDTVSRCGNCYLSTPSKSLLLSVQGLCISTALSAVYGIDWVEFLKSEHYAMHKTSDSPNVKFCTICTLLLHQNHNAHQNFENATHEQSIVQKAKEFRRARPREIIVKSEVEFDQPEPELEDDILRAVNSDNIIDNMETPFSLSENKKDYNFVVNACLLEYDHSIHKMPLKQLEMSVEKIRPTRTVNTLEGKMLRNVEHQQTKGITRQQIRQKATVTLTNVESDVGEKASSTTGNSDTETHQEYQHSSSSDEDNTKKRFKCQECPMKFLKPSLLKTHTYKHCAPQFLCSVPGCGKSFKYPGTLTHHMRSHETQQKGIFQCPECPMIFYKPSHIKRHGYKHRAAQFFCPECRKSFKYPESMRTHMRSH